MRVREFFTEGFYDFASDFVAASVRSRSYARANVPRFCAELSLHSLKRSHHNRRERAAPSRMNGCTRARSGICEKHGNAIGCLDAKKNSRRVGRERVTIDVFAQRGFRRRGIFCILYEANVGAVSLPAGCERPIAREKF